MAENPTRNQGKKNNNYEIILIDAVESLIERPKTQRKYYSEKKKSIPKRDKFTLILNTSKQNCFRVGFSICLI